jgi:hypothetical protein
VTVVRYGPLRSDSARTLAAAVPGAKLQLDQSFGSGLQLIVGSNFHGVQRVAVATTAPTRPRGTGLQIRTGNQDVCS